MKPKKECKIGQAKVLSLKSAKKWTDEENQSKITAQDAAGRRPRQVVQSRRASARAGAGGLAVRRLPRLALPVTRRRRGIAAMA